MPALALTEEGSRRLVASQAPEGWLSLTAPVPSLPPCLVMKPAARRLAGVDASPRPLSSRGVPLPPRRPLCPTPRRHSSPAAHLPAAPATASRTPASVLNGGVASPGFPRLPSGAYQPFPNCPDPFSFPLANSGLFLTARVCVSVSPQTSGPFGARVCASSLRMSAGPARRCLLVAS